MVERIKGKVRDVPDFPKAGILFKDITPVLQDAATFAALVDLFAAHYADKNVEVIAGIESRGFVIGSALAYKMQTGLALVRKAGKLPWQTVKQSYSLEYGEDTLEMHKDAVHKGQRVLVVDDLLATGGTAHATLGLINTLGAHVVGCAFAIELGFLSGRKKLPGVDIFSLITY